MFRLCFVLAALISFVSAECFVSGCNSEICSSSPNIVSTCVFQPWGQCYPLSECTELQNGDCGWTSNDLFLRCLYRNGCDCNEEFEEGEQCPGPNNENSFFGEICFPDDGASFCRVQTRQCPRFIGYSDDDDDATFELASFSSLSSSFISRYSSILSQFTGNTNFFFSISGNSDVRTSVVQSPSSSSDSSTLAVASLLVIFCAMI